MGEVVARAIERRILCIVFAHTAATTRRQETEGAAA